MQELSENVKFSCFEKFSLVILKPRFLLFKEHDISWHFSLIEAEARESEKKKRELEYEKNIVCV